MSRELSHPQCGLHLREVLFSVADDERLDDLAHGYLTSLPRDTALAALGLGELPDRAGAGSNLLSQPCQQYLRIGRRAMRDAGESLGRTGRAPEPWRRSGRGDQDTTMVQPVGNHLRHVP